MKVLYFDTETTGLDYKIHGLIQLAMIIEIDGEIKETAMFDIRPFKGDMMSKEALNINKHTVESLKLYTAPNEIYKKIELLFDKYIDRYDSKDKFYPAGYNVKFDLDFLQMFFKKNKNIYFGSYCNWKAVDALNIVYFLHYCGHLNLPNYKLKTVCEFFNIKIKAHDALSDIKATRELIIKLKEYYIKNNP